MKRILFSSAFALLLISCDKHLMVKKSLLQPLNSNFSTFVQNKAYHIENGAHVETQTFLNLFWISEDKVDSVFMEIKNNEELHVTFYTKGQKMENVFRGKLVKQEYFEIYLKNKKQEFPPGFNILYGNHDIYRIRIGLTTDNSIVIDEFRNGRGNLFLIIMGEKYDVESFFKTNSSGSFPVAL